MEAGAIDRVIVSDLTRVSRSTSTLLTVARAFRHAGVEFHVAGRGVQSLS